MNLLPDQMFKTFVPKSIIQPLDPSHFWICFVLCRTFKRTSSEEQRTVVENHLRHFVHRGKFDTLLSWSKSN